MKDHFDRSKKQLVERNKTLKKLKKVLDNLKITFFLEGGVLLGSVRNKAFIKWDHDVEIGIFAEKLNKKKILRILYELHNKDISIDFVNYNFENFKINCHEHKHTKFSILGFKKKKNYITRYMLRYPLKYFYPLFGSISIWE